MEQKKTLWIALSAGIFLLVVLGAALVIYSPGAKTGANAIAMRENGQLWTASLPSQSPSQTGLIATGKDPSAPASGSYSPSISSVPSSGSYSPTASSVPPVTSVTDNGASTSKDSSILKTDTVTVIADNANVYTKDTVSFSSGSEASSASHVSAMNKKSEDTIKETSSKKKETASTTPVASTSKSPASSTSASSSKPASSSTATAAKSTPAAGSSSSKSAIAPAAHYWVQVASYSTKDNADEARKLLDAKDLPCEVFTFTKDNKLYYRVRVGPYKTESEAEKWKKSVDSIELFKTAQSYVVNSSARASR